MAVALPAFAQVATGEVVVDGGDATPSTWRVNDWGDDTAYTCLTDGAVYTGGSGVASTTFDVIHTYSSESVHTMACYEGTFTYNGSHLFGGGLGAGVTSLVTATASVAWDVILVLLTALIGITLGVVGLRAGFRKVRSLVR